MSSYTLRHAVLTDRGRMRTRNEDAVRAGAGNRLYVVADGMGGHPAGDVASALAVDVVFESVGDLAPDADPGTARDVLHAAVAEAGRRVAEEGRRDPDRRGMGTTATALLVRDGRWTVAHVGDSRGYLFRDGELERVTVDHTVFPGSNTLTRALGTEEEPDPDVYEGELRDGDLFLLCSDGLTKVLGEEEIAGRLAGVVDAGSDAGSDPGLEEAARGLVEEANRRGGPDNVTVALVLATAA